MKTREQMDALKKEIHDFEQRFNSLRAEIGEKFDKEYLEKFDGYDKLKEQFDSVKQSLSNTLEQGEDKAGELMEKTEKQWNALKEKISSVMDEADNHETNKKKGMKEGIIR
jgi:predicted  nucleic acid-binding Zn-ribbon protein